MSSRLARNLRIRNIVAELNCFREQLAVAEELLRESSHEDDPRACVRHNHMRRHVRMEMGKLTSELRRLSTCDQYEATRKYVNRALYA
ncbi:hypothetical protein [Medusavirus stheno T3]|uniref:Uncharacterized protein n=1 Tax=Medusavirus stheno T3 TaxID=3069717 RepID=A0A7S7YES4_9VIRU|nr:hypothetical protein QKU73_gp317 [Acanthamoeba castellanii medusavirus]QPB44458.1 hypothetical protein [Medusavirus stheno T3]